jgi:Protein of unknown function (DUF3108)
MRRLAKIVALALSAAGVVAGTASAADKIAVVYDISLGGTRIMKADYGITTEGGAYQSTLEAKTIGMSKWFSKMKLNLSASGTMSEDAVTPQRYDYYRKKNDKKKQRNLTFASSGKLVTDGTDYDAAIVKAVSKQVMDPLSMLLKLSRAANPCNGKHRAFDGRDVFDVKLSGNGEGARVTCTMVYTPVAGGDVEDGDTEPKTYELTLARVTATKGYVPVRITGSAKGVGFDVNATAVSVNGSALAY